MKITELFETTSAGSVASVNTPIGGINRRATTPSLFGYMMEPKKKKKKKKKKKTNESPDLKTALKSVKTPRSSGDIAKMHGIENTDRMLRELIVGERHEMEHTKDRDVAREIALDHMAEDPYYYSKLEQANL